MLALTTRNVAAMVVGADYEGVQLDIEGLHPESKPGYEMFVGLVKAALYDAEECRGGRGRGDLALSVTVYMPKLVVADWSTYNITLPHISIIHLCTASIVPTQLGIRGVLSRRHELKDSVPLRLTAGRVVADTRRRNPVS